MKPTKKPLSSKRKIAPKPAGNKKSSQGEAPGPDEDVRTRRRMRFTGMQKFRQANENKREEIFYYFPGGTTFVHLASSLFIFAVRVLASKGARTFVSLSK